MVHSYLHFGYFALLRWVGGLLLSAVVVHHSAGAQCLSPADCQPGSTPTTLNLGFGILRVRLANVDMTTNGASDGYQDYSCRRAAQLDCGTTHTLQITTGPSADEQVRAWADFTQDGVFNPTSELIVSSVGQRHAGSFTVPTTLSPGTSLRLRIAADYIYAPVLGPCITPQYSQTEEYRVVVTAAASPRPLAAFSAIDSVTCTATVQLRDHTNWGWSFGDGTYSSQSTIHAGLNLSLLSGGLYSVRLPELPLTRRLVVAL